MQVTVNGVKYTATTVGYKTKVEWSSGSFEHIGTDHEFAIKEAILGPILVHREKALRGSDWRATVDYPYPDQQEWLDYRQEWRDFPQNYLHGDDFELPMEPEAPEPQPRDPVEYEEAKEEVISNLTYQGKRRRAYPPIPEQLDQQYHDGQDGTTTWSDGITVVKTTYPKYPAFDMDTDYVIGDQVSYNGRDYEALESGMGYFLLPHKMTLDQMAAWWGSTRYAMREANGWDQFVSWKPKGTKVYSPRNPETWAPSWKTI